MVLLFSLLFVVVVVYGLLFCCYCAILDVLSLFCVFVFGDKGDNFFAVESFCCFGFAFLARVLCVFYCLFFAFMQAFMQVSSRTFTVLVIPFYPHFCRCFLCLLLLRSIRPNCVACVCHPTPLAPIYFFSARFFLLMSCYRCYPFPPKISLSHALLIRQLLKKKCVCIRTMWSSPQLIGFILACLLTAVAAEQRSALKWRVRGSGVDENELGAINGWGVQEVQFFSDRGCTIRPNRPKQK